MSGFSAGPSASDHLHAHPHPHPNQRPAPNPSSDPAPVPESSNGASSVSASASGAPSKQSAMPMSAADDDDDMASGSEHNTEQPYGAGGDGDEPGTGTDMHHALTTQSLNSDGTPKRPMNAFMIFARRRRPQVSAANQMMRTGEISKILSKEWNSMPMHEKQFYLDQAKKLKDNFNSKYPDYVYRRRPNNSRRKRRADGSTVGGGARFPSAGPGGGQGGGDQHHDDGGSTEFSGESPVDVPSLPSALSLGADPGQGHSHSHHGHGGLTPQPPPLGSQTHHLQHHHAQQQHQHQQQHHHHPQIFTRPLYPPAGGEPHHPAYDAGPTSAGSHSSTSSYGYAYGGAGPGNEDPLGAYPAPHSATLPRPHLWGNEPSPGHHSQQQHQQHHPHSPGLEPLHAHHGTTYSPDEPSSTTSLWNTPSAGGLAPLHHAQQAQGARFDPTRTGASVSAGVGPGAHSGWPMTLPGVSAQQQGGRPRSLTGSTAIGGAGQGGSKPELFSPQIPHRAWSNTPSSGSSASATSTAGVAPGLGLGGGGGGLGVGVGGAAGMQFSTLTAPFFPGTSGAPAGENRSTSTSPTLARDPYYTTSSTSSGGGRADDAYDTSAPHSAYPISPISPPSSGSYFSGPPGPSAAGNGTASSLYPPQNSGGGHGGRGIQLPHPISTYNVSGAQRDLASPLSAGPASSVSHTGYWDRLNEGR